MYKFQTALKWLNFIWKVYAIEVWNTLSSGKMSYSDDREYGEPAWKKQQEKVIKVRFFF